MLVLKPYGGLGNQMFQYAYARWLQSRYRDDLVLDLSWFAENGGRSFSLGRLNLPDNLRVLDPAELPGVYNLFYKLCYRLFGGKFHGPLSFALMSKFGLYVSEDVCYYPFVRSTFSNKYVIGLFQSERYFRDIAQTLKGELRVKEPPSASNLKLTEEISSCNSVCVHVRRGDYVGCSRHEVCGEEYFRKALDITGTRLADPVYYIFSDDIAWVKEHYRFPGTVRFVEQDNPDYEELRLMYCCKHFIMSNSSFSWWASYLADNPGKVVVAPSRWFNGELKTDVHLDSWTVVPV
ncbi:alpha-1,2-fucosyltransferase [Geomonas sp. Red276]